MHENGVAERAFHGEVEFDKHADLISTNVRASCTKKRMVEDGWELLGLLVVSQVNVVFVEYHFPHGQYCFFG